MQIESRAAEFLHALNLATSIPVPIEDIAEFHLGFHIVPHKGLFAEESIDGFLSCDLTELHIDHDQYIAQTNRARFTLAHEIGHFVLHKEHVRTFASTNEWKAFAMSQARDARHLEWQANDFAGCLLMPRGETLRLFRELRANEIERLEAYGQVPDDVAIAGIVSADLARPFGVSDQVARIRMTMILRYPLPNQK